MAVEFPELISFGTMLGFAQALEQVGLQLCATAQQRVDHPVLKKCARKHGKRAKQLERIRRERLNEVVLQPIGDMHRADYLPPAGLPPEAQAVAQLELCAARFYDDAAAKAANVLIGVDRSFRKFAAESRRFAADMG